MTPVRRAEDLPFDPVPAGSGTSRQVLLGPETGSTFHTRRFVMEPGGGMPRHTNSVEHQQYVLAGRATVGIGDQTHQVRPGSVVHIPAGTPHWYRVEGEERFEFLCIVPVGEDRVELLETEVPRA